MVVQLETLCQSTCACKGMIGKLSTEEKNAVLENAADLLINKEEMILAANAEDIKNAEEKGMAKGMIDRLALYCIPTNTVAVSSLGVFK